MKTPIALVLALALTLGACGSDEKTPDGEHDRAASTAELPAANYAFPGFAVFEVDGRLWVFREGSKAHQEYHASGVPAESVTMVGAGPNRMTLRSDQREVLLAYTSTKPGFRVFAVDDRLWIFREGSEALASYQEKGLPAECVTRIGAGPKRETLRSNDKETLDSYVAAWR